MPGRPLLQASEDAIENAMAITLRLILGDQLNPQHSWFRETRDDVVYVLMELRQETDYVLHHAQKIIAIFAAMRDLAVQLQKAGHRMHYLAIDDPRNQATLPANLDALIAHYRARWFEYQAPDEWRLDAQLADYARQAFIPCRMADSEHVYTARNEAAQIFAKRRSWVMDYFYRHMRAQHRVLMDLAANNGRGQWTASTGCDAQPYFRIFNPITQSERFDAGGKFIRRYLPQLAACDSAFIHAPWRMDAAQQRRSGIIIGRDYPPPIVDHAQARQVTLERYTATKSAPCNTKATHPFR